MFSRLRHEICPDPWSLQEVRRLRQQEPEGQPQRKCPSTVPSATDRSLKHHFFFLRKRKNADTEFPGLTALSGLESWRREEREAERGRAGRWLVRGLTDTPFFSKMKRQECLFPLLSPSYFSFRSKKGTELRNDLSARLGYSSLPWPSFALCFVRKRNVWLQWFGDHLQSRMAGSSGSTRAAWVVTVPGETPGQGDVMCGCCYGQPSPLRKMPPGIRGENPAPLCGLPRNDALWPRGYKG